MQNKTLEEYKEQVLNLGNGEYVVESNDYLGNNVPIKMKHLICNYEYAVQPGNFIAGNRCPKCSKVHRRTDDEFKKEIKCISNDEYMTLIEFKNVRQKMEFKHKICGNVFSMTSHNFIGGQRCPHCNGNVLKTQEQFEDEVFTQRGDEYSVIGTYINSATKILMRHNLCETEWLVRPNDFIVKYSGCPCCYQSKGESAINKFLKDSGIFYRRQEKFEDLVNNNNKHLSYDFYLPNENLLIEYQGKQHETPVAHFGGEETFRIQTFHDEMKKAYAKNRGIELMEIWYYDFKNIRKILTNKLLTKETHLVIGFK